MNKKLFFSQVNCMTPKPLTSPQIPNEGALSLGGDFSFVDAMFYKTAGDIQWGIDEIKRTSTDSKN